MSNEVIKILTREAKKSGFKLLNSVYGDILLHRAEQSIRQSSGSVYGILVESEEPPQDGLSHIAHYPNLYPVYWGKDIAPVSRLKAHVQGHQANGNIDLRSIKEIHGRRLIFGAIFVERYLDFEKHLHARYRPLRGTNRTGSSGKIIEIMK